VKGKVAQYSLTPRGEVDGLILADGTEVHLPPFLSTQLVYAVKPGDAVTIHGLKAKDLPMIAARSVTNDASGATVVMTMPAGRDRGGAALAAEGKVVSVMHTPRGEANGVLLADGTIVRMPPGEVRRLGDALAPGKSIAVRGDGYAGPLGRVIVARQLGADAASLKDVAGPRWGERHMGKERGHGGRHGWMHDDDNKDGGRMMRGPMRERD